MKTEKEIREILEKIYIERDACYSSKIEMEEKETDKELSLEERYVKYQVLSLQLLGLEMKINILEEILV